MMDIIEFSLSIMILVWFWYRVFSYWKITELPPEDPPTHRTEEPEWVKAA